MTIMTRASGLMNRIFRVVPPERIVQYGLTDAIWPTIGQVGYCWYCCWCGLNRSEYPDVSRAFVAAGDHTLEHPEIRLELVEVELAEGEL